ncbi:hypothetical protein GCK32_000011 [Trichostrongylus colubriformis]|uniref:Uncharacterized protein n=1 Tax=Trichostrongylus colubriformis TaxID=6319 RepID=A0AAN8FPL4_TRICO
MLQSVSAYLMDERRLSRLPFEERQGSHRVPVGDVLASSHHHIPPMWYGIGAIEDFQPSVPTPTDNALSWAVMTTLPKRGPLLKARNRCPGRMYPMYSSLVSQQYEGAAVSNGAWQPEGPQEEQNS